MKAQETINFDEILDYIEGEINSGKNGKLSETQREQAKAKLQEFFASIETISVADD